DAFAQAVRGLGLAPVLVSPYQVEEIEDVRGRVGEELRRRVAWFVVTSPHAAVPALATFSTCSFKVAAVGRGTASALQSLGFDVDLVGEGGAGDLGAKIVAAGLASGDVVVHACGDDARQELR